MKGASRGAAGLQDLLTCHTQRPRKRDSLDMKCISSPLHQINLNRNAFPSTSAINLQNIGYNVTAGKIASSPAQVNDMHITRNTPNRPPRRTYSKAQEHVCTRGLDQLKQGENRKVFTPMIEPRIPEPPSHVPLQHPSTSESNPIHISPDSRHNISRVA